MRSFIHLLIAAFMLTSSTSAFARAFTENLHQAPTTSAAKPASGVSDFSAWADVDGDAFQVLELHQESGRSNDATASVLVVLVHNTCGEDELELLLTRSGDKLRFDTADGLSRIEATLRGEGDVYINLITVHRTHKASGFTSINLYKAILGEAGDVASVSGTMMFDNFSAIHRAGGSIFAAPRTKVLTQLGFANHSYDPISRLAVATR